MPDNPSLAEYLAQAQRGVIRSRGLGPALFGPDFFLKQTYFTTAAADNIFTTTFGRKVWHALNNQTRFFNAIPRVVWGNTTGWRVRSDRGAGRSRPVTETGTLPTVDVSAIQNISSLPRIVATTYGASVRAMFTAQLEGGVGDVLGMEMENSQIDHIKEINEELLAGAAYLVSAGAATTFTVPASIAHHYKIGDTIQTWDASGAAHDTEADVVSAVNTGTGVVTISTRATAIADGDVAYITARAGFSSIDDVVMEDNVAVGGGQARVDVYDVATRTAATWAAGARVSYNAGVGRDLTLALIDNAIRDIRVNGGEPNLMIMGHDQYFRLERLLQAQQRFVDYQEYQVGVGSEKTFPGTRTGMNLATYMGIPILAETDVPASVSTTDVVLGGNVYILDTNNLEIAIAMPTQYIENRDYLAANALVVRGLFYTLGELRCKNIWSNAKIADLLA